MVQTITTFALGAVMAAFAIYAVLLNEAEHAVRRRSRARGAGDRGRETLHLTGAPGRRVDGRRLPVGDFLFGALFLRGDQPLPFAELAGAAAESGLDINQTLAWLARAEESGLIERVEEPGVQAAAVRLTDAGMDAARNNRRAALSSVRTAT